MIDQMKFKNVINNVQCTMYNVPVYISISGLGQPLQSYLDFTANLRLLKRQRSVLCLYRLIVFLITILIVYLTFLIIFVLENEKYKPRTYFLHFYGLIYLQKWVEHFLPYKKKFCKHRQGST